MKVGNGMGFRVRWTCICDLAVPPRKVHLTSQNLIFASVRVHTILPIKNLF